MTIRRWTIEQDMHLVAFFEAVGVDRIAADLKRSAESVSLRVVKLKATCAWVELKRLMRADWEFRRNYHVALGQARSVEDLDLRHPGAPDDLGEQHGYFRGAAA